MLTYEMDDAVIDQVKPRVVIPHHYYIWDLTVRSSTLLSAEEWVDTRPHRRLDGASQTYSRADLDELDGLVHFFGDHVAFDKAKWRNGDYEVTNLNP